MVVVVSSVIYRLPLVVPSLFVAAHINPLALSGLRMDPECSGWLWTERSSYLKTNSVSTYSVRSSKREQNPTMCSPGRSQPCRQPGTRWSRGFVLLASCCSCSLSACSLPHLITGMGYPSLQIPWRWLLSHFSAAVISTYPSSWKPEEQPSLQVFSKLSPGSSHTGGMESRWACGVNFSRHGELILWSAGTWK